MPLQALGFLVKAVEKEPYNADYQFNLACVYAELSNTKQSSKILLNIIKNIDPTISECYFGVACNYFDSGNYNKAREYFDKYIECDEFGEFTSESQDVLYYMELYGGLKSRPKTDKIIVRLINDAKILVQEGEYKKACAKLDKAIEIEPRNVYIRNNLSLACFFNGEVDRAISVAKSVLKLDKENLFAHFSLAMLYAYVENSILFREQTYELKELNVDDKDVYISEMKRFLNCILRKDIIDEKLEKIIFNVLESKKNSINDKNTEEKAYLNVIKIKRKN